MKYSAMILGMLLPWYIVRFSVLGIPTNLFEVAAGGVILGWAVRHRTSLRPLFMKTIQSPRWLGFGVLSVIGVIASDQLIDSLGIWKSYFAVPGVLGLIAWYDESFRKNVVRGVIFSGVVMAGWVLIELILAQNLQYRPTAWFGFGSDPNLTQGGFANYIGLYLTPVVFFSLLPGIFSNKRVRVSVVAILILGILASQSYTALGALLLTSGMALGRFLWRRRSHTASQTILGLSYLVLVLATGFGAWQLQTEKFQNLFDMTERNSVSSRVQIWHASWEIIQENPILGIGHADFSRVYTEVIPTLYFPPHEWLVPEPHNLALAFWIHAGILGVVWLGLIAWKTVKTSLSSQWLLSLPMVSILAYGLFDTPFWKNDLAVIFVLAWVVLYGTFEKTKE